MRLHLLASTVASLLLTACAHSTPSNPTSTPAAPAPFDYATATLDPSTPEATARSLMTAMYQADPNMADAVFVPDAELRRLSATGEIRSGALPAWRDWLATLTPGQAREDLFDIKVEQSRRLATVRAPFTIAIDGDLRGCGVNAFTMVNMGEEDALEWRIVTGMDVQAEGCEGFRESFDYELERNTCIENGILLQHPDIPNFR